MTPNTGTMQAMRVLLAFAFFLCACGASTTNGTNVVRGAHNGDDGEEEAEENTTEDAGTVAAEQHVIDMCRDRGPGEVHELEDYSAIPADATSAFTANVTMHYAGEAWVAHHAIRMPHNHASRIAITNLNEFPTLERNEAEIMRFTLRFGEREVTQEERDDVEMWFTTYEAELLEACFLPPENGLDAQESDGAARRSN